METKPPHKPTDKDKTQAKMLAAFGIPHVDIAKIMGISAPTLRKYYSDEMSAGKAEATAKVAKTLFEQATKKDKPNISAAIFWLKAQAGWSDKGEIEKGKKEQRQQAAEETGNGKFTPRLVN